MDITNCQKVGSHHKHRKHNYDNNTLDEKKKKPKLDPNRL